MTSAFVDSNIFDCGLMIVNSSRKLTESLCSDNWTGCEEIKFPQQATVGNYSTSVLYSL